MRDFFVILGFYALLMVGCSRSSSSLSPSGEAPTASASSSVNLSPQVPAPPRHPAEAAIWSQLRQGKGYVILFRHALAPGTGDPPGFRLDDCSTQRNLSMEGQRQAMRLGNLLRSQNLVISRVLSSQWCRCLETARRMDIGQVEPFPVLNSFFQDRSKDESQTQQLRQFIVENQNNPGVMVMVTHQVNITAISGIVPQSGAAVVLRATGSSQPSNQLQFVGELNAEK